MLEKDLSETERGIDTTGEVTRFKSGHRDDIVVNGRLNSAFCTSKKQKNGLKIIAEVIRQGNRPKKVVPIGFNSSDLYFSNIVEANNCLDKGMKNEMSGRGRVHFSIPKRVNRCKGVISDWDMSLTELKDAIDEVGEIVSIERMVRRKYNRVLKKFSWVFTGNLLVVMEGNRLPSTLSLWGGITAISIRPYVESVKQCFQCYRYGHLQRQCRSEKRCVVCGGVYHGQCEDLECCVNCKGKHRANFKECEVYKFNKRIKEIMAEQGVSVYEAKKIATELRYNSYSEAVSARAWPKLGDREHRVGQVQLVSMNEGSYRKEVESVAVEKLSKQERSKKSLINVLGVKSMVEKRKVSGQGRGRNFGVHTKQVGSVNKIDEFYKQFDLRESEIGKENWGLALQNRIQQVEGNLSQSLRDKRSGEEQEKKEVREISAGNKYKSFSHNSVEKNSSDKKMESDIELGSFSSNLASVP